MIRVVVILAVACVVSAVGTARCEAADAKTAKKPVAAPATKAQRPRDKYNDRASVVLDKNCPRIVKPYAIEDIATEIAKQVAPSTITDFKTWLTDLFRKGPSLSSETTAAIRLAAKRANWLPMQAEVAYGAQGDLEQSPIVDRDSAAGRDLYAVADNLLTEISGAIGEPHDYQFTLRVLGNDTRNGFALPGGFVYVDAGLVSDAKYRSKAYFAMAHEMAHVLQRHETKELQSRIVDSITSGGELVSAVRALNADPAMILLHVKAEKNRFTQHHIDEELQADSCAVRMLARALPDREALATALKAFIADLPAVTELVPPATTAPKGSNAERLASTVDQIVNTPIQRHPTSQEREANLRAVLAEVTTPAAPAKKSR